jgi:hypothetical protein
MIMLIRLSTLVSSSPWSRADEGERLAALAHSGRSADAVDVDFGVVGDVEVDDVGDVGDVDAAAGEVGRDQHVELSAAEALHDAVALVLGEVAVDLAALDAVGVELFRQLLAARAWSCRRRSRYPGFRARAGP